MNANASMGLRGAGVPRTAIAVILGVVVIALLGSRLTPYDPDSFSGIVALRYQPPSWAHPFGTDGLSRDVLRSEEHTSELQSH